MRIVARGSLAFALAAFAIVVPPRALAQADSAPQPHAMTAVERPEEVTVRGRKTLTQYRLELERARDEIFRIFNEANEGNDTDVRCRAEQPTGSRVKQTVCRSDAERRASAEAGRRFLNSLFASTQGFNTNGRLGEATPTSPSLQSGIGAANAEEGGKAGEAGALSEFEREWNRILSENRDLYTAVTTYVELEKEYAVARGDTVAAVPDLMRGAPLAEPSGPQCEASTLTEFQQRNNVARVSGKVSISMCPAGTTGSFTLVARVRDQAGEVKPLEFHETWQRADAADHSFNADYPIGDNVELMSVRVRGLQCTCTTPAQ